MWHLAKRRPISLETAATAAGGVLLTVLDIHFEAFLSTEESVGALLYTSLISRCAVRLKTSPLSRSIHFLVHRCEGRQHSHRFILLHCTERPERPWVMSPSSVIDKNVSPSHGSAKETLGAKPILSEHWRRLEPTESSDNIQKCCFVFQAKWIRSTKCIRL